MELNEMFTFLDKINAFYGIIVAILSYFLGDHWILFVAFLFLNLLDYITGCMKAKMNNKINSSRGAIGIMKKLGYWIMIFVAFSMSTICIEIGIAVGIDLGVTSLIGWFVLASLLINEFRSIIENLVECGYDIPIILKKGLEVADKTIESIADRYDDNEREE